MLEQIPRRLAALLSLSMIAAGLLLIVWLLPRIPSGSFISMEQPSLPVDKPQGSITDSPIMSTVPRALEGALAQDDAAANDSHSLVSSTPVRPQVIGLADGLPAGLVQAVQQLLHENSHVGLTSADAPTVTLRLDWQPSEEPVYREVYALAARFDTVLPQAESSLVSDLWNNQVETDAPFQRLIVLSDTLPALVSLLGVTGLGEAESSVHGVATAEALLDATWADEATLVLLPFEQIQPELVVFAVDGQNPVDNRFNISDYPLVATVYAQRRQLVDGDGGDDWRLLEELAALSGDANRDPDKLTVLAMTGVTAMVRQTAYQMDQFGPEWVAEVVGPELAAADITAISNEVPFVPGCVTNTSAENLTFCSSPDYMAALDAVGADIVGLTGNHQNDYGREDALISLDIYAEAGLPVYGGGRNKEEAFAPLYMEHNGNRLAFLGANSYGPNFAWATDEGPGSAEFDLNILSATIRAVKEQDKADIVLVELQYQESYAVNPLWDQRQNFRSLSQSGADIVTGVQSHVPQAIEFEEGRLILYGLGNLFFDQMWRQDTREGLIVKHTFYDGRYISTQVLTTLLYDYGQPRWTSGEERQSLLRRVFDASYWPRIRQP